MEEHCCACGKISHVGKGLAYRALRRMNKRHSRYRNSGTVYSCPHPPVGVEVYHITRREDEAA